MLYFQFNYSFKFIVPIIPMIFALYPHFLPLDS